MYSCKKIKGSARAGRISMLKCLLGFLLVMLSVSTTLQAQPAQDWKKDLAEKLDSDSTLSYLHLVGYFDDLLYVDLYLANDAVDWVGLISFPDQDLYFELEGLESKGKLLFSEYDVDGRQSGFWIIEKDMNRYLASWQNRERSMEFRTLMFDEFWNPDYRKDFHKEISLYKGFIKGIPLEFEITRQHAQAIKMEWFDLVDLNIDKASWECQDNFCSKFSIAATSAILKKENLQSLSGEEMKEKLIWNFRLVSGKSELAAFQKVNYRFTQLKTEVEPEQMIIIEYPVLSGKSASRLIESFVNDISTVLRSELMEVNKGEEAFDHRWKNFAHAWFEVHYWDENYLSGKWVIQRNWTEELWSVPINYSIVDNESISLLKQFKSDFDIEFFLDHFAQNGIKYLPEYKDLLIRNKLQKADFKHLNFCKAGLLLSSGFDTIFGSFQLLVPYDEIDQYLRKRSVLKELLESR
jgi:hypothetical protein